MVTQFAHRLSHATFAALASTMPREAYASVAVCVSSGKATQQVNPVAPDGFPGSIESHVATVDHFATQVQVRHDVTSAKRVPKWIVVAFERNATSVLAIRISTVNVSLDPKATRRFSVACDSAYVKDTLVILASGVLW
jgi:hypothetical protein